jgi:hypothetical protein
MWSSPAQNRVATKGFVIGQAADPLGTVRSTRELRRIPLADGGITWRHELDSRTLSRDVEVGCRRNTDRCLLSNRRLEFVAGSQFRRRELGSSVVSVKAG